MSQQSAITPESHHIVQVGPDTIALPKWMDADHLSGVAHAVYNAGHESAATAWDEARQQARGVKQMFQKPDENAPADEKAVSLLGPLSTGIYKMGKSFLSQLALAKAERDRVAGQGEGLPAQTLTTLENYPFAGDIVKAFERGEINAPMTRGLVRAALLKGAADLSNAAISKGVEAIGTSPVEGTPLTKPAPLAVPEVTPQRALPISERGLVQGFFRKGRLQPTTSVEETPETAATPSETEPQVNALLRKHRAEVATNPEVLPEEEAAPVTNPTDAEVMQFVRKQFGKDVADRVSVAEDASEAPVSEAERARLAMDTLARYAAKNKTATFDPVQELADIRAKMGLGKKPSAEAMKTAGTATPEQIAEVVKQQKARPSGVPQAKIVTVPAREGEAPFAGSRVTRMTSGEDELGRVVTSPTNTTGEAAVRLSAVKKPFQDEGHGTRLYEQAALDARNQGFKTLRSDPVSLTKDAKGVWESLSKKYPDAVTSFDDPATGTAYRLDFSAFKPGATKVAPRTDVTFPTPRGSKSLKSLIDSFEEIADRRMPGSAPKSAPKPAAPRVQAEPSDIDRYHSIVDKTMAPKSQDLTEDWSKYITGEEGTANPQQPR